MKFMSVDRILFPRKFQKKWERLRSKGMLHFTFVQGGLYWGGLMFVIMTPLLFVIDQISPNGMRVKPHPQVRHDLLAPQTVLIEFGAWMVSGLVCGVLTWFCNEALYRRVNRP